MKWHGLRKDSIFASKFKLYNMRLMQLARQLGITQKDIVNFLAENDIIISQKSNEKIEDDHIQLISDHFHNSDNGNPFEEEIDMKEEPPSSTYTQPADDVILDHIEEEKEEEHGDISQTGEKTQIIQMETIEDPEIEATKPDVKVIRARKIKLDGIRVVGKIDLPEPKTKDISKKEAKSSKSTKSNIRKSQKRNNISFEEKQKRLKQDELRKKKQRQRKLKAKKKKYYETQVKTKINSGSAVKKKKRAENIPSKPKKVKHYNNPIMKFWAWLNGEFD